MRRLADDRGMTTIQVAVLLPAVLLWILLAVQYGLWWHGKQVANAAAAEALDAAQVPAGGPGDGDRATYELLRQSGNLTSVEVDVERRGGEVTVIVRGNAPQLVPGFAWSVTAQSSGPVERFVPQEDR